MRDSEQRKPQSLEDSFDNEPTRALRGLSDKCHTDQEADLLALCPSSLTQRCGRGQVPYLSAPQCPRLKSGAVTGSYRVVVKIKPIG